MYHGILRHDEVEKERESQEYYHIIIISII